MFQTAAQVDKRVGSTREPDATLALAEEQALEGDALGKDQPFRNDAPPHLPNPDGPGSVRTRLPKEGDPAVEQPSCGAGELPGMPPLTKGGDGLEEPVDAGAVAPK